MRLPFANSRPARRHSVLYLAAVSLAGALFGAAVLFSGGAPSSASGPIKISLDMTWQDNTWGNIGAVDPCVLTDGNSTFQFDVVIENAPAPGVTGFDLNIAYNPAIARVNDVNNSSSFIWSYPSQPVWNVESEPDTDGNLHIHFDDLSSIHETGEGVLARVQMQYQGAGGPGPILLDLTDNGGDGVPDVFGSAGAFTGVVASDGRWELVNQCSGAPSGPPGEYQVGVDMDSAGNTATSVGIIQPCRSTVVGQTFTVDVVVPQVSPPGIGGLGADLLYDPAVVKVVGFQIDLLLAALPSPALVDFSDSVPDTDGDFRMDFIDLGSTTGETGPGAIARVTLEAIGNGVSMVDLSDVYGQGILLITPDGQQYALTSERDGEVVVGGGCPGGALDSDRDTFRDEREDAMGTLAAVACPQTTTKNDETDTWPVDTNDDGLANTLDIGPYVGSLNFASPNPGYKPRLDLNANGTVNTLDVGAFVPHLNKSCAP